MRGCCRPTRRRLVGAGSSPRPPTTPDYGARRAYFGHTITDAVLLVMVRGSAGTSCEKKRTGGEDP